MIHQFFMAIILISVVVALTAGLNRFCDHAFARGGERTKESGLEQLAARLEAEIEHVMQTVEDEELRDVMLARIRNKYEKLLQEAYPEC